MQRESIHCQPTWMGSGSEEILGRRLFLWASKSSKSIHFLLDFHFLAGPPPLSLSVWLASLHSTYSLSCVAPLSLCSLALSRSFALSPRVLDASVQVLRTFEGVLIGITSLHPPLARPALFLPLFSHSHFTLPLTPSGYGWSSSYLNTYQSSPPPLSSLCHSAVSPVASSSFLFSIPFTTYYYRCAWP